MSSDPPPPRRRRRGSRCRPLTVERPISRDRFPRLKIVAGVVAACGFGTGFESYNAVPAAPWRRLPAQRARCVRAGVSCTMPSCGVSLHGARLTRRAPCRSQYRCASVADVSCLLSRRPKPRCGWRNRTGWGTFRRSRSRRWRTVWWRRDGMAENVERRRVIVHDLLASWSCRHQRAASASGRIAASDETRGMRACATHRWCRRSC